MKANFTVDTMLAARQHFWMLAWRNVCGNTELKIHITSSTRKGLIEEAEIYYGESYKELQERGHYIVHFVNC